MTKTEMKADILKLFSTPLVIAALPEAEEVNRALAKTILERAASDPGTQHSNLGGWQSTWDMESWGGAPLKKILTAARSLADSMTVSREGKPANAQWKMNCWANVNRSGEGNEFHTHPGAFWSATYYIRDGGCVASARGREKHKLRSVVADLIDLVERVSQFLDNLFGVEYETDGIVTNALSTQESPIGLSSTTTRYQTIVAGRTMKRGVRCVCTTTRKFGHSRVTPISSRKSRSLTDA